MDAWKELAVVGRYGVGALTLVLSLWASGHALAYKRDSRAATLWVGLIWLLPLSGAVLYFLFGVNRLRRWAERLRAETPRLGAPIGDWTCSQADLLQRLPSAQLHLARLAHSVGTVVKTPLVMANRVVPLENGDAAYPAMLAAIRASRRSVSLSTYIFDADDAGREFARELAAAVRRGVEVRVLVDATGMRYSWPPIARDLTAGGIRYARFLRLFPVWRLLAMNLRNHRKIMVVDGAIGFTGGMNLRVGHWFARRPSHPVQDLHFQVEGPVVQQLQAVFCEDWEFTTGEALRGDRWFPAPSASGAVLARAISDGPDEDAERLRWTLLAAVNAADHSIRIATPYFLPDAGLIAALNVAAMRGVRVDILLPEANNLPFVHWASRAHWWQVLKHGCRLWLSPPPFDHTKLMVIDEAWVLVGSANWDPRSLRLNFELNLEAYGEQPAESLAELFDRRRAAAREVTLEEVDRRPLPRRLVDGIARLFTPFL